MGASPTPTIVIGTAGRGGKMEKQKNHHKPIYWWILSITILIALGLIGYFSWRYYQDSVNANNSSFPFLTKQDKNNNSTTADTSKECASSALTSAEKQEIQNWKTYTNNTYKYSFKYPSDWQVTSEEANAASVVGDIEDESGIEAINFVLFAQDKTDINVSDFTKTTSKEVTIECQKATTLVYDAGINPGSGNKDTHILTPFTYNETKFVAFIRFPDLGASLSGDFFDTYYLILKTIDF